MSLNDTKTLITPEHVSVTYSLAGVGTRFAAVFVDTCIELALVVAPAALLVVAFAVPFERLPVLERAMPSWLIAILIVAIFAIMWGYYIFWETIWNGQTPGKRMAGIRVIRDRGYPIDFRAAFVRNIVRYADFLPGFYGVGALTMFISKESKRLGDYAAGTVVVMDSRPAPKVAGGQAAPPAYRVLGEPSLLNLRAISREQFAVVERFLARRLELPPKARAEIARRIALGLLPVIGMVPPADDSCPYEQLLVELAAAYRNRAGT